MAVLLQMANCPGYRVHERVAVGYLRPKSPSAIQEPNRVSAEVLFADVGAFMR